MDINTIQEEGILSEKDRKEREIGAGLVWDKRWASAQG